MSIDEQRILDDVIEDIMFEYKRTRSPHKAARALGLSIDYVWGVIDDNKEYYDDEASSHKETYGGRGPPALRKYVAGRTRAGTPWDNNSLPIQQARAAYEAGTHDMATGRDGKWLILYSIPLASKMPRPNYFQLEA